MPRTSQVNPSDVLSAVQTPVISRAGARFHESWDGPVVRLVRRPYVANAVILGEIPITSMVAYGKCPRSTTAVIKRVAPAARKLAKMGVRLLPY